MSNSDEFERLVFDPDDPMYSDVITMVGRDEPSYDPDDPTAEYNPDDFESDYWETEDPEIEYFDKDELW